MQWLTSVEERFFAPASVPVDFEAGDVPNGCHHCPTWRVEPAVDEVGAPLSREWHQPGCPTAALWDEDDSPNVAPSAN